MRSSYITSACLGSAGTGAGRIISSTNGRNEINTPDHQAVADWLCSEDEFSPCEKVLSEVTIDVVRILRDIYPLTRLTKVKFKVVQSTHMRAILGANLLQKLAAQDFDAPCLLYTSPSPRD